MVRSFKDRPRDPGAVHAGQAETACPGPGIRRTSQLQIFRARRPISVHQAEQGHQVLRRTTCLPRSLIRSQRVPDLPQELGIMAEGSILSLRGEKRLSVFARDIDAVRFEIGRVVPEDINHLVTPDRGRHQKPGIPATTISPRTISPNVLPTSASSGRRNRARPNIRRSIFPGTSRPDQRQPGHVLPEGGQLGPEEEEDHREEGQAADPGHGPGRPGQGQCRWDP